MMQLGHLINGVHRSGKGRSESLYNPSTGEITGQVNLADKALVEEAIAAAKGAFPEWRATPPAKRARIMFKFKDLLEQHAEEIASLIGQEHGKIRHDALGELQRGIENVEFACGAPDLLKGEYSKNTGPGIDAWSEFQPLGVVAGITPFNFPAMVPLWMYPIAIACGNTFVLKPSERDPTSTLFIANLAHEAGLPPGVLNVVNGDKEAVDALIDNPAVQAVSFVGSTPVAETIYSRSCANGKRCQALGGAKNHAVVMPDADMEHVARSLAGAAFGSSGERCMAISVAVTVGEDAAEELVARLKSQMNELKVGVYSDDKNDFGPLITSEHRASVLGHIDRAEADGADVVVDGRKLAADAGLGGFFVGGTLIDRVRPDMDCYNKEIFGPVLLVVRTEDLDEAMTLINNHEYGNGTCIYTRDGEAARYFTDKIEVGMVGVNVPLPVPVSYHSFGGWKRSLFGDLDIYGPDAVRFYTRRKTVTQRWPSGGVREQATFSFPS